MTARAARIERVRELLEERRHPERRVGVLSATNLTRLAIRFGAAGAGMALVNAVLGSGPVGVLAGGAAVALADEATTRLWRRIGRGVQRGWSTLGGALAVIVLLVALASALSPRIASAVKGGAEGWLDARRAALDARQRERRVSVAAASAEDARWRLLLEDGAARMGTLAEARRACDEMGPGWALPAGLGGWPEMDRYPDFGATFYVWAASGMGLQVGDGLRPGVAVSGSGRATEVRPILCLKADA